MTTEQFLGLLAGVQAHGDYWTAKCPAHRDDKASLSVREGDTGKTVIKCFAGCEKESILSKLNLEMKDLFPDDPSIVHEITAIYDYTDESGAVLYQAIRYWPKDFKMRRPDGTFGIKGVGRVLYHLQDLSDRRDETVYYVEGEKDADTLKRMGLLSTTAIGGVEGWQEHYAETLRDRDVIIIPDNDPQGSKYAQKVKNSLDRVAASVVILELPNLPPKGDVTDWKNSGGTAQQLSEMVLEKQDKSRSRVSTIDHTPQPVDARDFHVEGESMELADWALHCLGADARTDTFIRARQICRVVRDATPPKGVTRPVGNPFIEPLPQAALRDRLARLGKWTRTVGKGKAAHDVETIPPIWLVDSISSRSSWPLHSLEAVMETPTMRPDGSILSERGYDIPTGILMQPSAVFPPVPVNPTQMEVMESGKALLEPISDFPFRGASDRAAAIAAILSLVARPAIDGPIPMFAFRAPAPGTGKSLLADVISMIGTGRHPSHMAQPDDDVELRKLILTIAMQGLPLLVIDNAAGKIGSPALSAALTSSSWQDRILGSNKVIDAPLRCVWLVTGNNITFKGDLARRVVASDLDAGLEHPEDRPEETFSHYPLIEWVATERPRLVSAVLTLLRGFHMAGRPKHGAPQKGSFESWDSLVRGCLIWSGIGDPDEGKERIRSEDDSDTIPLAELFRQLKAASLGFPFTTAEIIEKAKSDSGLESALMEAVNRPKLDARGLGYVLRNCKDRIVEGLRVCVSKSDGGRSANKWIVRGDSESGV